MSLGGILNLLLVVVLNCNTLAIFGALIEYDVTRGRNATSWAMYWDVRLAIRCRPKVSALERPRLQFRTLIIRYACPGSTTEALKSGYIRYLARKDLVRRSSIEKALRRESGNAMGAPLPPFFGRLIVYFLRDFRCANIYFFGLLCQVFQGKLAVLDVNSAASLHAQDALRGSSGCLLVLRSQKLYLIAANFIV